MKRSQDLTASKLINEALLCRMFKCRPSELENEDAQKLQLFMSIYVQMGEKNPFIMM